MEKMNATTPDQAAQDGMTADLERVFGKDYSKLLDQVSHDDPSLTIGEVVEWAWSLIPLATTYMGETSAEDLIANAILVHEGYEAERRIQS